MPWFLLYLGNIPIIHFFHNLPFVSQEGLTCIIIPNLYVDIIENRREYTYIKDMPMMLMGRDN